MSRLMRVDDTPLKQQYLNMYRPLPTIKNVSFCISVLGGLLFIFALVLLLTDTATEYEVDYTSCTQDASRICTLSFQTSKKLTAPVYVYYQLTNFFQNHRDYVLSRSASQLRGETKNDDIDDCTPLIRAKDSFGSSNKILYPCGLIAASTFDDTFSMTVNTVNVDWTQNGVAWKSDLDEKFKKRNPKPSETDEIPLPPNGDLDQLPEVDNPNFVVWNRQAARPDFRKLYRIIEDDIPKAAAIEISVENNYDETFDGKKSVVISTSSWIGGKNAPLGTAYLVTSLLFLVCAGALLLWDRKNPSVLGDLTKCRDIDYVNDAEAAVSVQ